MNDEEIKKALECCISLSCEGCPLKDERGCLTISDENALALINRQQAEIDDLKRDTVPKLQDSLNRANKYGRTTDRENARLKAEIERLTGLLVQWKKVAYKYADSIEEIKTEARKEFAAELISALKIDEFSWFEEESERLVKAINELAEGSEIKCQ